MDETARSLIPSRFRIEFLEPISKSFEEDNEAGKLDKAEEIVGVVLPTNEDAARSSRCRPFATPHPADHCHRRDRRSSFPAWLRSCRSRNIAAPNAPCVLTESGNPWRSTIAMIFMP